MSDVVLTEAFLAKIAGWEAMKKAKALLKQGSVLSSNWTPPLLKGVVQEGSVSYRAGLVIKDTINLENICRCRPSQEWGTICAHSVSVGLHHLRPVRPSPPPATPPVANRPGPGLAAPTAPRRHAKRLLRADPPASGEPVEVHVILPPNFAAAVERGKVMACFEGKWSRGRSPLNSLPLGGGYAFSAEDLKLLDHIEQLAEGDTPGLLMLSNEDLAGLLGVLTGHPRVTLGKSQSLAVDQTPWRIPLTATLEGSGEIRLQRGTSSAAVTLIAGKPSWVLQDDTFRPASLPAICEGVVRGPVRIERAQVPAFLSRDWPQLQAHCEVAANFRLSDFSLEPKAPEFMLALAGGLAQLQAQLQCAYGARIMTVGVTSKAEVLWLPDPQSPTRYSTRDLGAEQAAVGRLLRAGFSGPDPQGRYLLQGQNQVLNFFARLYPRLQEEWKVTLEERLERTTSQNLEWIEPRFEVTPSGEQWFDLDVSFASHGGERFSSAEIQRLVLSGQGHTRLKNGRIALVDTGAVEELQEVLLDCAPQQHANGYRLKNNQAGFLQGTLQKELGWKVEAPAAWRERAARQTGETQLDAPPLGPLDSILRPYQKQGVAWLWFLRENNFGGILADEMGLGKTLQTLAYFYAANRRSLPSDPDTPEGARPGPHMVICPTSLVFNWEAEARKFVPGLKVLVMQGGQRKQLFDQIGQVDLVITSYALLRRDAEMYKGIYFDTVVLDEAQHIKNRQTQNAQAVKAVRSAHRLVLTGTPLENSVLDLWSIFDFLMTGYLGPAKDFRERYEIPITREKNAEAQARLIRRVRPFLLRRLKRDVAKELPERIEQVAYCEMTEDQRAAYQQILELSRREVLEAGPGSVQKSRMVVLNALLRLRQICCDLRLLKLEGVDPERSSGKMDLFGELLEEVLDGGHRVLVFSQFVQMLALLGAKLKEEGIEFCYLDGSTTNRGEVVERFQSTASIPVFLISLKAGGVGLNLTGADTVIHFDPWWNPAVEAQATDRAHRIGQTRVVTSYKLITRGTVEEKILSLQTRKRELLQTLLSGEEALTDALNWEEIQELLS